MTSKEHAQCFDSKVEWQKDLENRFKFHPATTEETKNLHESVRDECGNLADLLNALLPESREKALAITKLEEVMFWANAAIARNKEVGE